VVGGTSGALAAKQATRTVPVVFVSAVDPVMDGLVTSLARPGGNVTGLSANSSELAGKRLEQLTQAVQGLSQVAVLWQPGALAERTEQDMRKEAEVAARALGVRLQFVKVQGPGEFDGPSRNDQRARWCSDGRGGTMFPSKTSSTWRQRTDCRQCTD
jgi:putative ABC transport system substrate-binding protein